MGSNTLNYGLVKPGEEDYYNIEDFNSNADIIDSELKKVNDSLKSVESRGFGNNTINIYVDANIGNDSNDGTDPNPFKTIDRAITEAYKYNGHQQIAILLESGAYTENVTIRNYNRIYILGRTPANKDNTFINGSVSFYNCQKANINNLTINTTVTTANAVYFESVIHGTVRDVNINHSSYNTNDFGTGIVATGSNVYARDVFIGNARRAIVGAESANITAYLTSFNNNNYVVNTQLGCRIALTSSSSKGVYDVEALLQPGCIYLDDKYISLSTGNITN